MTVPSLASRDVVMIVDDMPANLSLLSDALEAAGYEVLVALDGDTALGLLQRVMPDLILLDAVMPGIDGFQTCRRIKAAAPTCDIPVIFMTALSESEHVVRGFEEGAVDYVTKPVRPVELLARVSAHLREARRVVQARRLLERTAQAVVGLDGAGRVLWSTERARLLLGRHYGAAGLAAEAMEPMPVPLRQTIERLLRGEIGASTVTIDGVLRLSIIRESGGALLHIDEQRREWPLEPLTVQLGLSRREAEVLMWVAFGKTNREIGAILRISPRTVNKHLDHVYEKLGVETRTAAAGIAQQAHHAWSA